MQGDSYLPTRTYVTHVICVKVLIQQIARIQFGQIVQIVVTERIVSHERLFQVDFLMQIQLVGHDEIECQCQQYWRSTNLINKLFNQIFFINSYINAEAKLFFMKFSNMFVQNLLFLFEYKIF